MAKIKTPKATILISTLILVTIPAQYSYAANSVQYRAWGFECGVTIMDPHISISLKEKGKGRNIKIDAYSKCKLLQKNVVLSVELYKRGFLNPIFVAKTSTDALDQTSSGNLINNFKTYKICRDNSLTRFWGRARGSAFINGKQYFTPWVQSEVTKPIACGT